MKINELSNKKILIVGYGKEGKVTEQYLKTKLPNAHISIADQSQGQEYLLDQKNYDIAIKSPGVPKELLQIPYTTATNLFFGNIGKNITLGITGSKGKSTTSSLIFEILKKAGKKVRLLGNIGSPMLEVLLQPYSDDEIFVIELSSYQLADIAYSPHIAVITSLFPEHMDYHGSIEEYYEAKHSIIKYSKQDDYYIYNDLFPMLAEWAEQAVCKSIPYKREFNLTDTKLWGEHNKTNIRGAVTVAKLFSVSDDVIRDAVKNFPGLPHRLQMIGTYNDITFFDDAISTTPESTIEAIKALKNVDTILLGGMNRGYDFSVLVDYIKRYNIGNIVLFPDSGEEIEKELRQMNVNVHTLRTSSMEEAVKFAYRYTKKGMICLLSTASPSYSIWKNFEEKGDIFQKFVKQLHEYKT